MALLKNKPIAVLADDDGGPVIITYSDLQKRFRFAVYNPLNAFTELPKILRELSEGQATILAEQKRAADSELRLPPSDGCKQNGPWLLDCVKPVVNLGLDFGGPAGIACSDGSPRINETKEEFRSYIDKVSGQSQLVGESWAAIMTPCTAWHARPAYRYDGNFTNDPAHPILYIADTVDPATPLPNAFKMAERSKRASILHQKSEGHCSHAAPSMCTGRAIRRYFQEGGVASESEDMHVQSCRPDRKPFDGYTGEHEPALPKGETDEALWRALVGINRGWHDW
ncbi:hypothetical protein CLAFUW4_04652 [Fulvia fulva]|uniref:Peptidase S33 tripeptidyl aminopeptidase-like C-terminal domain-containing protein n=1 Tax=Passalora fulva TaxID=5499 RepID=A0A9Q8P7L2_PASFU|nr:uncharacterized protein CLAFUR5_04613 [Fulvia fulva]KAK4626199.1 hypothetical protein CLAFUR4_04638 [Fulvia fulva]KAK4628574.1 hypothetical protein CLAFUR0_04642 [Fulvia fulva]UJO16007.1 hypothetical protein CLAFUR5_04613 [Fulvia fulva]WPV13319.1 hypothetical protein CLAFUW4_04652 [Fulvia fulva]WPV29180.1 hypothetical protein CLAFUW7_04646 [Fulvia fulva]